MACLLPAAPEAPRYLPMRRCTGTTRPGTATRHASSSEVAALANRPGVQVLGKRLARLVVFGQPVTGPGRKQGIGQGAHLLFQVQVRPCHGCCSSPGRIREKEPDEAACMCGRFTLRSSPQAVAEAFGLPEAPDLLPRFNIAPGQPVAVVRQKPQAEGRELALLRWGLIPVWADDPSIGNRLANARSETVATKPSFRRAFRSRGCLVVADGFYEWQRTNGRKQPYIVGLQNDRPFGLAGLWERWEKVGEPVESCTILTTDANELMQPIHERMPVIFPPDQYGLWLDPRSEDAVKLAKLLRPFP